MWALWNKSLKWHSRPSELIGLDDPYVSWCFDEVVYSWGNFVTNELDKASAENREKKRRRQKNDDQIRQQKLAQLLDLPMEVRYRSFRQAAGKAPLPKEK